ncbi:fumarylacetoacetate hydrolase family protein [Acinetobacter baumannii]|uniref:fumarylacetoacetate hydrolase family protein n=1 Tax=Acinetobacter baumannii TaxID=470 RepID=UPI0038B5AE39
MRFVSFSKNGINGIGIRDTNGVKGLLANDAQFPGDMLSLIQKGQDALTAAYNLLNTTDYLNEQDINLLPPLSNPPKVICVGLNYADHTKESPYEQPDYPTLFSRFNSSLIGHQSKMIKPTCSDQLDFEGELAVVIGKSGKHIQKADALQYVMGYSVFNDGSVRDYQFKSPQWTVGKNFDATGAFGPDLVTADELPEGAKGLMLTTRLNGEVVQHANTSDMLFDIATLISTISEAITLEAGDVIVTGTPSGIGFAREPKLFMKHGDVCEVEIEKVGVLSNPIADE